MTQMTEYDIQKRLRYDYMTNPKYIVEYLQIFKWESDFLLKTKEGYWHEVEIKMSLSDFQNNSKNRKEKFEILETGKLGNGCLKCRPNYFSFCVTEDMVDGAKDLIPSYAGLYYVKEKEGMLVNVKEPQKLHSEKIDDNKLRLTEKFYKQYRSSRSFSGGLLNEVERLKSKISFLQAEYKAATENDIKDVF